MAAELKRYFPKRFDKKGKERNELSQMREYLMAKIAHAINPTPETEQTVQTGFAGLMGVHLPLCFRDDPANALLDIERGFARLLVTLSECGCPNPDTLTVFQFYTWLDSLEEKYEAQRNALKPNAAKR